MNDGVQATGGLVDEVAEVGIDAGIEAAEAGTQVAKKTSIDWAWDTWSVFAILYESGVFSRVLKQTLVVGGPSVGGGPTEGPQRHH